MGFKPISPQSPGLTAENTTKNITDLSPNKTTLDGRIFFAEDGPKSGEDSMKDTSNKAILRQQALRRRSSGHPVLFARSGTTVLSCGRIATKHGMAEMPLLGMPQKKPKLFVKLDNYIHANTQLMKNTLSYFIPHSLNC